MNKVKDNSGSTLILTLVMVTIFSLLFITLAIGSINNSKQINMTENDIQTTSLAEMGVLHQRTYIMTELVKISTDETIMQQITDEFINTYGYIDPEEENIDDYSENYLNLLIEKWTNELSTLNTVKNSFDNSMQYEVVNYSVNHEDGDIIIQFISRGKNAEEEISLRTKIKIPIKSSLAFDIEYLEGDSGDGGGNNNGGNSDFPSGNQIEEPTNLTTCRGNVLNGGQCQINGSHVLENGNNEFRNAIVKITGTLNVNGNLNNSTNSTIWIDGAFTTNTFNNGNGIKLHVGGSANFNSTLNNLENSILEILGSATFSNVQNAKKTIFYIGGQANFNGHLDLEDRSIAFINGNATFSNQIKVTSDSKLCVNGHLTVNGNITGSNIYAKSSNNSNVNTNSTDFETNCKIGGSTPENATQLYPFLKLKDDGSYTIEDLFDSTIEYNY